MNTTASIAVGVVLVVGVGGLVYWQTNNTPTPQGTETPNADDSLTAAAVAMHNNATSCWSIINGNVYDLTSWIPQHPGGPQAILKLCGMDGSEEFKEQHGGQALQAQVLAGFKLGVLSN